MTKEATNGAAIPSAKEIVTHLAKLDSFIWCARETIKATKSTEGLAANEVLLYVQNSIYDLRVAIDPSIDPLLSGVGE